LIWGTLSLVLILAGLSDLSHLMPALDANIPYPFLSPVAVVLFFRFFDCSYDWDFLHEPVNKRCGTKTAPILQTRHVHRSWIQILKSGFVSRYCQYCIVILLNIILLCFIILY
jgi:hypothetical protein